jgi:hypothetical protein
MMRVNQYVSLNNIYIKQFGRSKSHTNNKIKLFLLPPFYFHVFKKQLLVLINDWHGITSMNLAASSAWKGTEKLVESNGHAL